jgi:hypothetical protein
MENYNIKVSHVFWGVLFIAFGGIILINNFTNIIFNWGMLLKLWPLIFILWGVSLLFKTTSGKAIMAGLIALIIAISVFAAFQSAFSFANNVFVFEFEDEDYPEIDSTGRREFIEPFDSLISNAVFNLRAGAGTFRVTDTSDDLMKANIRGDNVIYEINRRGSGENAEITLNMRKQKVRFSRGKMNNNVLIALNETPIWDMDLNVGAASLDFDLSPYIINRLNLETGAASIKLKFGDKSERTDVKINAGASSLEILVPESAGCEIRTNAALSSKNFSGFDRIEDDIHRTGNFDTAQNKILLNIDTGISSVTVRRY